jgi:transmembrane sensor
MLTPDHIKTLLQRYQQGLCTPEEITRLETWFDRVWQHDRHVPVLSRADEERLVRRLQASPRYLFPEQPRKVFGLFQRMPRLAVAMWIGLLLAAGTVMWLTVQQASSLATVTELAFIEVNAAPGKRVKFTLPDSSEVWLNSGTQLAYHPRFAQHREVRLRGEAFFEVTPDHDHPFTVKAGPVTTQVYGTGFNIASWPQAGEMRVALQHGRIGVTTDTTSASKEQFLAPGELLIYNQQMNTVQLLKENTTDMGAWISGKLIFNKVQLKEVLAQLETMYAIHCIYPDGIAEQVVTARFDHASLDNILAHISFGWDVQFQQKGDTLIVR